MKIVIPMAGLGSRFSKAGYEKHKPLITVNDKSLIRYTIESLDVGGEYIFVCRDLGNGYLKELEEEIMKCTKGVFEVKIIDRVTTGAAETALHGLEGEEDYDGELIVTNCDQYLDWNSVLFLKEARKHDGALLTFKSTDPKNSYAEIINGKVVRTVEKDPITDDALVGVHYWKNAQDFIKSTKKTLHSVLKSKETYVSETYNHMIEAGKDVGVVDIHPGKYWSTGTPEDLALFKGMISEYYTPKNNSWFIDLDGTIFNHAHRYSDLGNDPQLCPGVQEALDELDSRGDTIILVSARKESARDFTEKLLERMLIPYDQLILGVSQGCRVIVNDIISDKIAPRSRAVNVITDKGWSVQDLQG